MKIQRVEWHSYLLVYEYEVDDAEIEEKFGDVEIFREKLASDDEDFDDVYEYLMEAVSYTHLTLPTRNCV